MTDLLTRLESGSGADAALEVALCERLGIPWPYKPILTSLDAALSLVERMLPAWQFTIYHDGAYVSRSDPPSIEWGRAKTPARSLCAALLRALQ